ncbi:ferric reductase [Oceanicola sp. 22II-s10i]|uniref:ferric reductase-like transmembrane domain-containing protein n=1 Tax=Oceanicola sp. 22II-s10i TaxID=1317116 RepID=UPI000B52281C|nr:ferric reductase-like transmembrane domain-containing protein [Oceanicola sp. 22II-s10i]OWU84633.1 ferric reductase [Oceanicola sp. 22II-s10i]
MRPLVWAAVVALIIVPVALAAVSPLLQWRGAAYIAGGFAGILSLALLLLQPLLAAGYLPGPALATARRWHRRTGAIVVVLVLVHVGGLYVTSPPDTLDALLLVSPTPFSVYGVTAMWGVLLTALLVALRRRIRPALWRAAHNLLALVVVLATVIHALQIEGAMEPVSKWVLCLAALAATVAALVDLRLLRPLKRRRTAGTRS